MLFSEKSRHRQIFGFQMCWSLTTTSFTVESDRAPVPSSLSPLNATDTGSTQCCTVLSGIYVPCDAASEGDRKQSWEPALGVFLSHGGTLGESGLVVLEISCWGFGWKWRGSSCQRAGDRDGKDDQCVEWQLWGSKRSWLARAEGWNLTRQKRNG